MINEEIIFFFQAFHSYIIYTLMKLLSFFSVYLSLSVYPSTLAVLHKINRENVTQYFL